MCYDKMLVNWYVIFVYLCVTQLVNSLKVVYCINTETCRSNLNINFTLPVCAYVGVIKNIKINTMPAWPDI